jgi:hypothetical protein
MDYYFCQQDNLANWYLYFRNLDENRWRDTPSVRWSAGASAPQACDL